MNELNLPKLIEDSDILQRINDLLNTDKALLWSGSATKIVCLPFTDKLADLLFKGLEDEKITGGFDSINRILSSEAKGLSQVDKKTDQQRVKRISRLLVISNDCSERFLRKIDKLAVDHKDRLLVVMLDIDSERLGELIYGEDKLVKSLLLEHKEIVAEFLQALI